MERERDYLKELVSRHSIMLKCEIPKVGIRFVDCLELISFHFGAQLMLFSFVSVRNRFEWSVFFFEFIAVTKRDPKRKRDGTKMR